MSTIPHIQNARRSHPRLNTDQAGDVAFNVKGPPQVMSIFGREYKGERKVSRANGQVDGKNGKAPSEQRFVTTLDW